MEEEPIATCPCRTSVVIYTQPDGINYTVEYRPSHEKTVEKLITFKPKLVEVSRDYCFPNGIPKKLAWFHKFNPLRPGETEPPPLPSSARIGRLMSIEEYFENIKLENETGTFQEFD